MREEPRSQRQGQPPAAYLPFAGTPVRSARWVRLAALLLGLLAFGAIFVFTDVDELWAVLQRADGWLLTLPVLCMLASYATMARSYQGICEAAGCPVALPQMLKITFVANAVNYLVSTGGLSGFAVRMYYFTSLGIPSQTAVLVSLAQTFLTNLMLLAFLLLGFVYVLGTGSLQGSALVVTTAMLGLLVLAAILAALLLFHARLRRRTLFRLAQTAHWVLHRVLPHKAPARTHIWRYQFNLNRGIAFLLAQRRAMIGPVIYIALDWVFTILILYSGFVAVQYAIPITHVIVGFAVGIVLSFASLIPGGLGVMEGSMAAVFASMDVPFETAVVAVLIFRIAYYLLPLLLSLFFMHGMFVQGTTLSHAINDPKR